MNLYFPSKIKVGYSRRDDTYTKKLAFITYYDHDKVLRKEKSWEKWRDKSIEPDDFDNVPMTGFVINRNGGGTGGRSWDTRKAFVRIYDPRGFEFEIDIDNLMFILELYEIGKGKVILGEFVYAWSGTSLILLPVDSEDYNKAIVNTSLASTEINIKDAIVDNSYEFKDGKKVVYFGEEIIHDKIVDYYDWGNDFNKPLGVNQNMFKTAKNYNNHIMVNAIKKYIFYNIDENDFFVTNKKNLISRELDYKVDSASLYDTYYANYHSTGFTSISPNRDYEYFKYLYESILMKQLYSNEYMTLGDNSKTNITIPINLVEKVDDNTYYLCSSIVNRAWVYEFEEKINYWTNRVVRLRQVREVTVKRKKLLKYDGVILKYLPIPKGCTLKRDFTHNEYLELFNNEEQYSFLDMIKADGKIITLNKLY